MKNRIIRTTIPIVMFSIIVVIAIFGFGFFRNINWKWGYQSKVQEELEPIKKELKDLRERIAVLEKNCG